MAPSPFPFALTGYGLPHVTGFIPTRSGQPHPAPLDAVGLMDAASRFGLAGVEFALPSLSLEVADRLRAALAERGRRAVIDFMVLLEVDADHFRNYLRAAARVGTNVVRAMISRVLCGDRRSLAEEWDSRLAFVAQRLREVLPLAHDLGLSVALENHQDATTADLLRLAEMVDHPAFGVTLDTGNPLSVGEDPLESATLLAPIIRHVHLKDYTIHFAPEGYRLVRCVAGSGVVDFPAILRAVQNNGHDLLPGIEIAAQPTRTIPILDPGWWTTFPRSHATNLPGALRVLWKHGRPAHEPYSSAWERGESSEVVSKEEWDVVRASVEYFKHLSPP
jgi:sugar phosphate isomerase/epimerase